jgi:hypothetical protein
LRIYYGDAYVPPFNEGQIIAFMKVWGYFDASGNHTNLDGQGRVSPAVSVAGYLATPMQWSKFDKVWKERLDREGLGYFHMADFVSQTKLFKDRNQWTKERRDCLIKDLIQIISGNVVYGLAMAVMRADYDRVKGEVLGAGQVLGSPFAFCAFRCFESGVDWAKKAKYKDSIKYVFEDGDEYKHEVLNTHTFICRQDGLREFYRFGGPGTLAFEPKPEDVRALQAADILAYETHKEIRRRVFKEHPYSRNSLVALQQQIPGDYREYVEEDLRGYLQDFSEKRKNFIVSVPARLAHKVLPRPSHKTAKT